MDNGLFERLLGGVAQRIGDLARRLTESVSAFVRGKTTIPQRALTDLLRGEFDGPYVADLTDAMHAVTGARLTPRQMRQYLIGDVTLSRRLYQQAEQTAARVRRIVTDHARYGHDARKLALELYEGYGFRADEALKPIVRLPRYLDDALLNRDMDALLARLQASRLKTPALRAAYLQMLDAILKDKGRAAIDKALRVAVEERYRYFANRIAQTELARAQNAERARELLAEDAIEVVRYQMSATHPKPDLCDAFARADRYGLGPGLYPKGQAPLPPCHPFCRCVLFPVLGMSAAGAKVRPGAITAYLRSLDPSTAARVAGSRDKLAEILSGERGFTEVINLGRPAGYRVGVAGDVVDPDRTA